MLKRKSYYTLNNTIKISQYPDVYLLQNSVNLASEPSDEIYSTLLCLSRILNSPQGITKKRFLGEQEKSGLLTEDVQLIDTDIWKTLFEFQKDAVKGAINKIRQHNGCIIADSVGLGKTFEALAVIKYFELLNNKVLVLCPKKLRDNWTIYRAENNSELNPFLKDRFGYTVLSHTDLSRESGWAGDINLETINWGNITLMIGKSCPFLMCRLSNKLRLLNLSIKFLMPSAQPQMRTYPPLKKRLTSRCMRCII